MFKKEGVLILVSLFFLLGAGCQNNYVDISECEKISDDAGRVECADNFYFNEAERSNNPELCDNIYYQKLKSECSGVEEPLSDEVESPFEQGSVALDSGDIPPKPK